MAKKRDIRQIEAIAREFDMDFEERREFGDYIEECKRNGEKGTGDGGDFTYRELREKVPEFRGRVMGTNLIDLRQANGSSHDDLSGLSAYLCQLVGEPFRFARVSYGDELTLHFGDLRPARSPKLRHKPYGAYVLGLRGSSWVIKSGSEPVLIIAGDVSPFPTPAYGKPLGKEELETGRFVGPDSRVLVATPFVVRPVDKFGLQLRMSDGSTLFVLPANPEPDEPGDEGLPELADWELSTPRGLLSAGPELVWSFTPAKDASPALTSEAKS